MTLAPAHPIVSIDGRLEPATALRTTPGGLIAPVVFDGIRVYRRRAPGGLVGFRVEDHWRRLAESAKLVRLDVPDLSDTTARVVELLRANGVEDEAQVLAQVYVDDSAGDLGPHPTGPTVLALTVRSGGRVTAKDGWRLRVTSWRKAGDLALPPRTKMSMTYFSTRMADLDAWADGYDGAIFLTADGKVAEGSGYNIFMLRHGRLVTPPVTDEILEGITRATLLAIVPERLGVPVQERAIDRSELYVCDELFVCGTSLEVTPVLEVDHFPVGDGRPGPVTRAIRDAYFAVAEGAVPEYGHWLTPLA